MKTLIVSLAVAFKESSVEFLLKSQRGLVSVRSGSSNISLTSNISLMEMGDMSPSVRSSWNGAFPRFTSDVFNELWEINFAIFVFVVLIPKIVQSTLT